MRKKRQKIEREKEFEKISTMLKAKNYTKLKIPTLKQMVRYLKKEKGVSVEILDALTIDNISAKWDELL